MSSNDPEPDPVLAALRELRTYDVSPAHAQHLRTRCHSGLHSPDRHRRLRQMSEVGAVRRAVHILAGAWCVLYLFETIRLAAAAYGF